MKSKSTSPTIEYALEPSLAVEEFIEVLIRSTLAKRRPIDDRTRIRQMLSGAQVICTARHDKRLVGVARAITDFSYCTYLADLAVDQAFQRIGIGRELVRRTHQAAGPDTNLILLAAPDAASYYPHIGLTRHESCWVLRQKQP